MEQLTAEMVIDRIDTLALTSVKASDR